MGKRVGRVLAVLFSAALVLGLCPAWAMATTLDQETDSSASCEVANGDANEMAEPEVAGLGETMSGFEVDSEGALTEEKSDNIIPTEVQIVPQASNAISGTWGTCPWEISADGILTVHPGIGANTSYKPSWSDYGTISPWSDYSESITSVKLVAEGGRKVVLPEESGSLFKGFWNCETIDVSGWDISSVTSMHAMFNECYSLASIEGFGLDISSVTDIGALFSGCWSLSSLDVSEWDTSSVTDMASLFWGCESLSSLDVTGWDTSSVTNMYGMFYGCRKLTSLDVSGWDTSSVVHMGNLFSDCRLLTSLDISNWDTSSVVDLNWIFANCASLSSLDVSKWDTSSVNDMDHVFYGCSKLSSLDVSDWDTSSAWNMNSMFYGCSKLSSLDLAGWDTSSVTDMGFMFENCTSLVSLDLAEWDTSSVRIMWSMFSNCKSLKALELASFDTSNVTAMNSMFSNCSAIKELDLSSFDTHNVERMEWMFTGCTSLEEVDVSNFDVSSVWGDVGFLEHSIYRMFKDCSSLQSIDVSSFDVSNMSWFSEVFTGCDSLQLITLNDTFSYRSNELFNESFGSLCLPTGEWTNGERVLSVKDYWQSNNDEDRERFKVETEPFKAPNMAGTWVRKVIRSIDDVVISDIASQTYTGKPIEPAVKVTLGGKELTKDIDYSLSYKDNVSAGTASVIVTGIGAYTGSKDVKFEIVAPAKTFPDVKAGAWYVQVVGRAAGLGLVTGYADGRFGPDDSITRGQVAVILWRMAGQPRAGSGTKSFPDVKPGAYYYNAVSWASSAGVVSGYASGKFGPNDKVTREQLAVMLANYARKVGGLKVSGSKADFASMKDAAKVAGYAQPAVGWCFRNKILSGSQGNVLPKGNATRAQAAKMLVFLYDMVN